MSVVWSRRNEYVDRIEPARGLTDIMQKPGFLRRNNPDDLY